MTDTKDKKREKLGILCCTAGATSWGLSGTCSEALFSQYPVDTTWVTAVRMTSAGIILLFLAFAKHSLNLKELGLEGKTPEMKELWSNRKISAGELNSHIIPGNHFLLIGIR